MNGNSLVIKAPWMTDAKESLEVVKWFNGHGKALDLLRAQQMLIFLSILRLMLPAVTRWTIHYCCLRQIKKVLELELELGFYFSPYLAIIATQR
jgi:hypothetical protein